MLQINLLGQLAFVAGNEYTVVQVFATMVLLGTGTATGGGYLMSYGEVRPPRLQLSSSKCSDMCSLLTGCTLPCSNTCCWSVCWSATLRSTHSQWLWWPASHKSLQCGCSWVSCLLCGICSAAEWLPGTHTTRSGVAATQNPG